jgi:hypothetical protein
MFGPFSSREQAAAALEEPQTWVWADGQVRLVGYATHASVRAAGSGALG